MAKLIRSLPRTVRTPMLDELAKQDKALADRRQKQLYQFEDLQRLEDRDLQKVLGQCRTDVLVLCLAASRGIACSVASLEICPNAPKNRCRKKWNTSRMQNPMKSKLAATTF